MPLRKLAAGFLDFRDHTFMPSRDRFARLAERQEPKVMMIGCSDSRVDPAILCHAEPGDVFMVRNVANLVPPCESDVSHHGTSAALEFAVTSLGVEHIIVLGHDGCGGIRALLDSGSSAETGHASFVGNWMRIADEALRRTRIIARNRPLAEQAKICGLEAIKTSLANLLSFPWIDQKVDEGRLRLHGWYFDINDGNMYVFVPSRDAFEPLTLELATELQSS
jgi:carbonic anhydrase